MWKLLQPSGSITKTTFRPSPPDLRKGKVHVDCKLDLFVETERMVLRGKCQSILSSFLLKEGNTRILILWEADLNNPVLLFLLKEVLGC